MQRRESVADHQRVCSEGSAISPIMAQGSSELDVDLIGIKLQERCSSMVKEVMVHLTAYKSNLLATHAQQLKEEHDSAALSLSSKQGELGLTTRELSAAMTRVSQLETYLRRCCDAYVMAKERAVMKQRMVQAWYAIRQNAKQRKNKKWKHAQACRWHDLVYARRQAFRLWYRWYRSEHRRKEDQRRADAVNLVKREMQAELEEAEGKLQAELQAARDQVQQSNSVRDQLEEDMRRAFMRGVCALNIEAMSIMKRGPNLQAEAALAHKELDARGEVASVTGDTDSSALQDSKASPSASRSQEPGQPNCSEARIEPISVRASLSAPGPLRTPEVLRASTTAPAAVGPNCQSGGRAKAKAIVTRGPGGRDGFTARDTGPLPPGVRSSCAKHVASTRWSS